jgi:capsular polysaccharide biosynthesis protein
VELRRYVSILRRRALLIALAVIVAVGVTAFRSKTTPTYTATSVLYVGQDRFTFAQGDTSLSGDKALGLARVINTFSILIDSVPTAQSALNLAKVPGNATGLVARTEVKPVPGTTLMYVKVTDLVPTRAQALSTAMAEAFVAKIKEVEPGQALGEGDIPAAPVRIYEKAALPLVPTKTSVLPNLFIAGLMGLLISSGLVLLVEYLDITVKSAGDAERKLELPVLAAIPILSLDPTTTTRKPAGPATRIELVQRDDEEGVG